MINEWKIFFKSKNNIYKLILACLILVSLLAFLANFLNFIETRQGFAFKDILLSQFSPVDLSWLSFSLIYSCLVIGFVYLLKNPKILTQTLYIYSLIIIYRIIAMSILPLEAPATTIHLIDPLVEIFGTGQTLTKDLFFSGHTSFCFMFFLVVENKLLKYICLGMAISVAISVLAQHVHYSVDVFCAPFFTYSAFKLVKRILHFI